MVLAFESSVWTDPTSASGSSRLGPDRRWLTSEIQYWNLVSLMDPAFLVSKSPYLDDGWSAFNLPVLWRYSPARSFKINTLLWPIHVVRKWKLSIMS